jgi:hypothetical protein
MEGRGIVIQRTARKEMLGSSLTGGAKAVGVDADRLTGRPGKVERLIDSASRKDHPHRCRRTSGGARMRATEDVEFQVVPPP